MGGLGLGLKLPNLGTAGLSAGACPTSLGTQFMVEHVRDRSLRAYRFSFRHVSLVGFVGKTTDSKKQTALLH